MANVSWHSKAENVDIMLNYRSDFLLLTIRDDGQGFNPEEPHRNGVGLKSMAERAGLIGGELQIDSKPDKGTRISLKVPYQMIER
jgi:signal transduction histidine kinase